MGIMRSTPKQRANIEFRKLITMLGKDNIVERASLKPGTVVLKYREGYAEDYQSWDTLPSFETRTLEEVAEGPADEY
ncbi:hypothetical protein CLAFUW4_13927 [Fulvia fulva]|uniref:Uncharacterized protein n=1 Tax=Passalora fulva TaxID=5499 RepID=A0A9Q8UW97_PASFU|nr:uncharacterized protein CLAFUR5_13769 [Fulvia fulva]KAK4610119.1 hypothetical protein CLAFUR4_13930 [Fulvia fulva]KAK4610818.1 hypothetical protein CLAFUR0_13934 [Fulvia fulva]UJO24819.1 hypothetical protein CLAFUR5_13769 [Fulvia fulva]WPV21957.1 hypothetical protein CLAFUW4_13927 [Fulvia fulva]WPV37147.1 hypothetical protein CLAFUW7_13935 [Fulvia fulva]